MEVKKSPGADIEKRRNQFFQLGFILSLAVTLCAFEWSDAEYYTPELKAGLSEELPFEKIFEAEIQIQKPTPPKQDNTFDKNIGIVEVTENPIAKKKEKLEFKEIDFSEFEEEGEKEVKLPEVKYTPKKKEPMGSQLAMVNGFLPHYKSCNDLSGEEMLDCVNEEFRSYLQAGMKMPSSLEYTGDKLVVTSFVVDESGKITDVYIVKENKYEKDVVREVKRALMALPPMIPGQQGEDLIKVRFTLPVKLSLH